jgi:hypothetical protein
LERKKLFSVLSSFPTFTTKKLTIRSTICRSR